MIRWCAYCQRFLGEAEPYDQLMVSHGLCHACLARFDVNGGEVSASIRDIAAFFARVLQDSLAGLPPNPAELLASGRALGIRDMDLLIGIMQPILYEMGRQFGDGQLSVQTEHRFSAVASALVALVAPTQPPPEQPRFLLGLAPDNHHRIGPSYYALLLAEEGITVDRHDGLDPSSVVAYLARLPYVGLGLSVAMPEHFERALAIATAVRRAQPDITLALGGHIAKDSEVQESAREVFDWIADPRSIRDDARALAARLRRDGSTT